MQKSSFTFDTTQEVRELKARQKSWNFSFLLFLLLPIIAILLLINFGGSWIKDIAPGVLIDDLAVSEDKSLTQTSVDELPFSADVLTEDDPILGERETAIMQIVVFEDFDCPFCGKLYPILKSFVLANHKDVLFQFRDFPIQSLHPQATQAALAANCAKEVGKFWNYHDILFENQQTFSDEKLLEYALQAGIAEEPFRQCLTSQRWLKEIQQDYKEGVDAGVRGTPTLFINNIRVPGVVSEQALYQFLNNLKIGKESAKEVIQEENL